MVAQRVAVGVAQCEPKREPVHQPVAVADDAVVRAVRVSEQPPDAHAVPRGRHAPVRVGLVRRRGGRGRQVQHREKRDLQSEARGGER